MTVKNTVRYAARILPLVAALAALPGTASAQEFGQNKVQYRTFDWQIIQTEHFDVYFYPVEREAALDVARIAERSYARLSRILHHNFSERKPILLYASYSEFQETNALGGESPGEGTEGSTSTAWSSPSPGRTRPCITSSSTR